MIVRSEDVRPGKCFLSNGDKPRIVRVLSVQEGLVRFEARSRTARRSWGARGETALPEFVAGLAREVGSDFLLDGAPRLHV